MLDQLSSGQQQFRSFFLQLIANRTRCHKYFAERYDKEYGAEFIGCTKELMQCFVLSLDNLLPPCAIDRVSVYLSLQIFCDILWLKFVFWCLLATATWCTKFSAASMIKCMRRGLLRLMIPALVSLSVCHVGGLCKNGVMD